MTNLELFTKNNLKPDSYHVDLSKTNENKSPSNISPAFNKVVPYQITKTNPPNNPKIRKVPEPT